MDSTLDTVPSPGCAELRLCQVLFRCLGHSEEQQPGTLLPPPQPHRKVLLALESHEEPKRPRAAGCQSSELKRAQLSSWGEACRARLLGVLWWARGPQRGRLVSSLWAVERPTGCGTSPACFGQSPSASDGTSGSTGEPGGGWWEGQGHVRLLAPRSGVGRPGHHFGSRKPREAAGKEGEGWGRWSLV